MQHEDKVTDQNFRIELLGRQEVFENALFRVYADHVVDSHGNEVPRYLSVVPRCLVDDSVAGVAVLPVAGHAIGLMRVLRHPLQRWSWEVVKGHGEPGESPAAIAERELMEETGLALLTGGLRDLGSLSPEAGVIQARSRLFAALVDAGAAVKVEPEFGHGEFRFFDRSTVLQMIAEGEIEDASSLVLVYKWLIEHESNG
ncbi:NUDIX hydrolase [Methylomonas sp. MO1]|uniref:NUDIX hydrolase n=1 Tax=unclassified Methylomonas TaxID=2608980 RepID=UPI00047C875B|nr:MULTISPECIES: NUDIX hydrolase [unclassified Methylomonas]MDT4288969.1 NUDIX hydrolase [Methylomonas sp. MO1]